MKPTRYAWVYGHYAWWTLGSKKGKHTKILSISVKKTALQWFSKKEQKALVQKEAPGDIIMLLWIKLAFKWFLQKEWKLPI